VVVETKGQQDLVEIRDQLHQRDQKVSRVPRVPKVIKVLRVHHRKDQKDLKVVPHKVTLEEEEI
jgi:hypothetical protein